MVNWAFAIIAIPDGTTNPNLVLITSAVNDLVRLPYPI